jgi:hypothetical protein
MAKIVLFISASYVKQFTAVQGNMSDDKVNIAIQSAQTKYILPALGKPLYDYLVDNIFNAEDLSGLPPDYLELVEDYITPALNEWTLYNITLISAFQYQNKGVVKHLDQYSQSTPLDELKYLRGEIRNNAEWHQKRLQNFLKNNSDKFVEYSEATDDLAPSQETGRFSSGICFSGKNRLIKTYSEENPLGKIIG